MTLQKFLKKKIDSLPKVPGVYFFKEKGEIIYIGKAKNLKKRVKTHFAGKQIGFPVDLKDRIEDIEFIETNSEQEAILLERELIKKYQPKFNIDLKDDKNFFYVVIGGQDWPRVYLTHQPSKAKNTAKIIGPFVEGKEIKQFLQSVRTIIPYRSCKNLPKKPCLYFHLNLCPAPCKEEIKNSTKEREKYLLSLQLLESLLRILTKDSGRIEGYDISHLSSTFIVGGMVVFLHNKPEKKEYRRFKIKNLDQANDPLAIKEIISRRLKHSEWEKPDLIVIDGGKAHLKSLESLNIEIPFIGITKNKKHQPEKIYTPFSKRFLLIEELPTTLKTFLKFINQESHRFAISYHRLKREKIN